MIEGIINEQIAAIMVLPHRIVVPMVEGVNLSLLKYPLPEVGYTVVPLTRGRIYCRQIAAIMVLPHRIVVPMVEGVNLSLLKYPLPEVGYTVDR